MTILLPALGIDIGPTVGMVNDGFMEGEWTARVIDGCGTLAALVGLEGADGAGGGDGAPALEGWVPAGGGDAGDV
jgi:hypothetical protein